MLGLPDDVVAAVGRITIAAGELELVLAAIDGMQNSTNAFDTLAKPGEPLRAARRVIDSMAVTYRDAYIPAIGDAAQLLAKRHAVVHAMWVNDAPEETEGHWQLLHYKTQIRHPADPQTLDDLALQLMEARNRLVSILTAQINRRTPVDHNQEPATA